MKQVRIKRNFIGAPVSASEQEMISGGHEHDKLVGAVEEIRRLGVSG